MGTTIDIKTILEGHLHEVLTLRFGVKLPQHPAVPATVLETLFDVRARLDRVEELLSAVVRLAARVQEASALATAQVDDAWDTEILKVRKAPVAAGGEFSSAKERNAEANLAVLDMRHKARAAAELYRQCDSAASVIRLAYRGLESVRQDLRTWLDSLKFESHLDR